MIKMINLVQIIEICKVSLELIGMVCKGIQELLQQRKSKKAKTDEITDNAPESEEIKE